MSVSWAEAAAPVGDPLEGVDRPRGDALGVQALGGRYASGAGELTSGARQLLGLVGQVLGQSWSGTASAACAAACVRSAQAVLLAAQAYENAGGALSAYGARLAMAQAEYDAARHVADQAVEEERAHRAAASAALGEPGGGAQFGDLFWRSPMREVARSRAEQAVADAAVAAREAAGVLDATLTPFRPAEPTRPELGWSDQAAGFGRGVKDGVVEPVAMVGGLVGLNGDTGENWSALGSGLAHGFTNPGDFAKALVNWDDIENGEYGHWAGELVPSAVAAFFTGGAAAGVKGAQATAAAQRTTEALKAASGLAKGLPEALKDAKVLVAVTPDGLRVPVGIDATKLRQLWSEALPPAAKSWRVPEHVPGPARGKELKAPHWRHTVSGARNGEVKAVTSVILRGHEQLIRDDVADIAAGRAAWDEKAQRYRVNGRSYGVESSGTVFPDSGPGIAKLDRNEYAALTEIARAGGDVSKVAEFKHNPRFLNNPQAIAKAKAIYDGEYPHDL